MGIGHSRIKITSYLFIYYFRYFHLHKHVCVYLAEHSSLNIYLRFKFYTLYVCVYIQYICIIYNNQKSSEEWRLQIFQIDIQLTWNENSIKVFISTVCSKRKVRKWWRLPKNFATTSILYHNIYGPTYTRNCYVRL